MPPKIYEELYLKFLCQMEKVFDEKIKNLGENILDIKKAVEIIIKTKCDGQELEDHIESEHPHSAFEKIKNQDVKWIITTGISALAIIWAIFFKK